MPSFLHLTLIPLFVLSLFGSLAQAETIPFQLGESIDLPVVVSSPDNSQPRTIIFPNTIDHVVNGGWNAADIKFQAINNTIVVQLRNPSFVAMVQVYDVTGQVYLISVRAAAASETPDPALTIVPPEDANVAVGGKTNWPVDTDSAAVTLGRAMLSGRIPDGITVAPFSRNVNGHVVAGVIPFEDDLLQIRVMRMYLAPNLKGYEIIFTWKGDRPVRIPMQRLTFPGAITVHCSEQTILPGGDPQVVMQPHAGVHVYYIATP